MTSQEARRTGLREALEHLHHPIIEQDYVSIPPRDVTVCAWCFAGIDDVHEPWPCPTAELLAALADTHSGDELPEGTKLVLMSDELFAALGADRVEWGEPDEHGWYSPTLYRDSLSGDDLDCKDSFTVPEQDVPLSWSKR
jgi:hypothetical protein